MLREKRTGISSRGWNRVLPVPVQTSYRARSAFVSEKYAILHKMASSEENARTFDSYFLLETPQPPIRKSRTRRTRLQRAKRRSCGSRCFQDRHGKINCGELSYALAKSGPCITFVSIKFNEKYGIIALHLLMNVLLNPPHLLALKSPCLFTEAGSLHSR